MGENRNILLCAGGTGGHLFPAQALARELTARGWLVHLATDVRAQRFVGDFEPAHIHIIKSATLGGKNPVNIVKSALSLGAGYWQSKALLKKLRPVCVIGFGGYPTVPPVMAASAVRLPVLLHEQNAVMGRANRFLSKKARLVVMGFGVGSKSGDNNSLVLGNPVRLEVQEAARKSYHRRKVTDRFNLLVFGGSQGAQYFSKVVPEAIGLLDQQSTSKLNLVQQARAEDELELRENLEALKIKAKVAQFFSPMAKYIAEADFVISRAGASTVSELAVIGRPSILVPYPFALDHDQAMNAAEMEKTGGCKVISQAELSAQRLADELHIAINQPDILIKMADKAKLTGKPEAATKFCDLVEYVISGKPVEEFA